MIAARRDRPQNKHASTRIESVRAELTCRSENPALKQPQKATIRLEVKYAPEVTLTVDRTHITEGDDLRFTCTASANPALDLVYKWYKNDEVVIGDVSTTLILPHVTRDLNGAVIACEVANAVGARRAEHVLSVHFGPVWRTPLPAVHGADLGQQVKLTCDVDGNPQPEITWLFEKSPRVLSTDAELVIGEMSYELAGRYVCRAAVRGFDEIVAATQVFIKGKWCRASSGDHVIESHTMRASDSPLPLPLPTAFPDPLHFS